MLVFRAVIVAEIHSEMSPDNLHNGHWNFWCVRSWLFQTTSCGGSTWLFFVTPQDAMVANEGIPFCLDPCFMSYPVELDLRRITWSSSCVHRWVITLGPQRWTSCGASIWRFNLQVSGFGQHFKVRVLRWKIHFFERLYRCIWLVFFCKVKGLNFQTWPAK